MNTKNKARNKTRRMTYIGIFGTLAFVVMLIAFPLPFMPPFLEMDFSDVVLFVAGLFLGPGGMIVTVLLKNILHWLMRGAAFGIPVDQLTSMIASLSYLLPTFYFYQKYKGKHGETKALIAGLIVATLCSTLILFVANYFVITPFYFKIGGMPLPDNYLGFMLLYLPFNLIKGALLGTAMFIVFPMVSNLVKKHQ